MQYLAVFAAIAGVTVAEAQYMLTTIADGQPQAPSPMPYSMLSTAGPVVSSAAPPPPAYTPSSAPSVAPVVSSAPPVYTVPVSSSAAAPPPAYTPAASVPAYTPSAAVSSGYATGAIGSSAPAPAPSSVSAVTPAPVPSSTAGIVTQISDNQPQAPSPVQSAAGSSSAPMVSAVPTPYNSVPVPAYTPAATSGFATGAIGGSSTPAVAPTPSLYYGGAAAPGASAGAGFGAAVAIIAGILMA